MILVQTTGEHLGTGHGRIKNVNKNPTCENFVFKSSWGQTLVIYTNCHAHLNMLKLDVGKELDQNAVMSGKGVMCNWSTESIDELFGNTEIEQT